MLLECGRSCGPLLRPRMGLIVDLQHVLHGELGVTLRGRKPLVAEHLLNGAEVCAFLQHVGAESMAQGVRVDVGGESLGNGDFLDNPSDAASGETAAAMVDQ